MEGQTDERLQKGDEWVEPAVRRSAGCDQLAAGDSVVL